jgi:hypothetical protein
VAVVALLLKENLPPLIAMFGVAGVLRGPHRRVWGGIILASVAWVFMEVFWLIPAARGGAPSAYWSHYAGLGSSPSDAMRTLLLRPWVVGSLLLTPENGRWLWQLLAPVGLVAMAGLDVLLLGLPLFLQHMLSASATEHTILFSYGAMPAVFVFLATVYGLRRLLRLGRRVPNFAAWLGALVVACAGWTQMTWGAIPEIVQVYRQRFFRDDLDWQRAALLRRIPPEASVIASFNFLPALSRRPRLYAFHTIYMYRGRIADREPYALPEDVDYALVDVNDPLMVDKLRDAPPLGRHIAAFYRYHPWDVVAIIDSLLLMRAGQPSRLAPYEVSRAVIHLAPENVWAFHGGLLLVKPEEAPPARAGAGAVVPVDLTWQLRAGVVSRAFHPIGYRLYPTWAWSPGQLVREHLYLLVPTQLHPGPYALGAQVVDEATRRPVPMEDVEGVRRSDAVRLGTVEVHR